NFKDVLVVAAKEDYASLGNILNEQEGSTSIEQRKAFAAKAFQVVMNYDIAINNYFNPENTTIQTSAIKQVLRYGENPHQQACFF
ncbi:bifunctional phosphoribosylaminoimidazolecarboxamide formyltransferase/IMP cyclohydrolase, partial [Salmonella enterica]